MWPTGDHAACATRETCAAGHGIFAGAARLPRWHQVLFACANEVLTAHRAQGIANHRPVVGVVVAQQGFVQLALLGPLHDMDFFTGFK